MKKVFWLMFLLLVACGRGQARSRPTSTPAAAAPPTATATAAAPPRATARPTATPIPSAAPSPSPPPPGSPVTSPNFRIGARVTRNLSAQQLAFLNQHFYDVMTPLLGANIRHAVQGPKLILYRSIQGTWEGFDHFDWEHIDAHENMFLHHGGERIQTVWGSWLMNPGDFVDENAPDALDHWINYYALTAAQQVHEYHYDGLFIDSASHWLNPHAVRGVMPDDYDLDNWYADRVRGLAYIKAQLPDKIVVFNGLHNQHGAEDSLANTDGGMWETFAFRPGKGTYAGEKQWLTALELVSRHPDKFLVLVVKEQPGLTDDIQKRVFSVGSYLLVSGDNVVFSMADAQHIKTNSLLYYPEYTLDLGEPLGAYTRTEDGLYLRRFEKGLVLVNPSDSATRTYTLPTDYLEVIPQGGGEVDETGHWEGKLTYQPVSGQVTLPPVSALLLVTP